MKHVYLPVDFRQQLDQPLLAVGGQDGEGVLVDDGPQVGVHQDGVRRLHVDVALGASQLPCNTQRQGTRGRSVQIQDPREGG